MAVERLGKFAPKSVALAEQYPKDAVDLVVEAEDEYNDSRSFT